MVQGAVTKCHGLFDVVFTEERSDREGNIGASGGWCFEKTTKVNFTGIVAAVIIAEPSGLAFNICFLLHNRFPESVPPCCCKLF